MEEVSIHVRILNLGVAEFRGQKHTPSFSLASRWNVAFPLRMNARNKSSQCQQTVPGLCREEQMFLFSITIVADNLKSHFHWSLCHKYASC